MGNAENHLLSSGVGGF